MENISNLSSAQKKTLCKELHLSNIMQTPKIKSIVISMTTKDIVANKNVLTDLEKQLAQITGQKPLVTYAKKSIANFKLRAMNPIGVKVTLRGKNMNNFLYKLINIILPRTRDFKGLSLKSFDGEGNYNIGIREQISFPEIDYDKVRKIYGVNISIVTSAKNNNEGIELFKMIDFPFVKESK